MNLEPPRIHTPVGYDRHDSHDGILDLVARLRRFHAERKDVDDLEWSLEDDAISVATANDIQTAGRRALRFAQAHKWQFVGWCALVCRWGRTRPTH